MEDILQDKCVWAKQAEQRKATFAKYFAPYRGNSANRVAAILMDLIDKHDPTIPEK